MKYVRLTVIAFACALILVAKAHADDPQHEQAAIAAVEALNMASSGHSSDTSAHATFMQLALKTHTPPDVAETRFSASLPVLHAERDASMREQARIYASHFSTSELNEIARFYRTFYTSPVGQKVILNQPTINAEYAAISGKLFRDFLAHAWTSADAQSDRETRPTGRAQ